MNAFDATVTLSSGYGDVSLRVTTLTSDWTHVREGWVREGGAVVCIKDSPVLGHRICRN